MITIIPIEPLNDEHALLIIEAFNRHFINGGGKEDGYGAGDGLGSHGNGNGFGGTYGFGDGDGYGNVGKCPEEWRAE